MMAKKTVKDRVFDALEAGTEAVGRGAQRLADRADRRRAAWKRNGTVGRGPKYPA